MGFEVGDTAKLESQYEKLNNQLLQLKKNQADLDKSDLSNIKKSIDSTGKSVTNVIKKIGRWALAVFAVESAYGFVRTAISTLSGYNEQLASDIEYIQFALASALQPIIETIVSWVYRLLQYINYISQAWFGVNLFANATADAMNKTANSAKDVKKSLAGFDEMNVVSSTSSSNSSSGITSPSVDLSSIDGDVPKWIEWIADNKDTILNFLKQLGIIIATLKISDWITGIGNALGLLNGKLTVIKGLGIGLIIFGIYETIQGIVNFIKDPSWENFLTILQGISLVVAGIALLTGNWITAIIALGVALVTYIIQNWDKIKEILGIVGEWIYENVIKPVIDFFQSLWDTIVSIFSSVVEFFKSIFLNAWEAIKYVWNGATSFFNNIWNNIENIFKNVSSFFKNILSNAWNAVKNVFSNVGNFFKGIWDTIVSIFGSIGSKIGDTVSVAFKTVINSALSLVEKILNVPIKAINGLLDVINAVPGINIPKINTITLPRLKVGGIINLPGKGVPIGGGRAIGGESGAEGVIPLTDSQAMEQLGASIGKYITINLTNNTNLDGRLIQRQQSQITANKNFATNR